MFYVFKVKILLRRNNLKQFSFKNVRLFVVYFGMNSDNLNGFHLIFTITPERKKATTNKKHIFLCCLRDC